MQTSWVFAQYDQIYHLFMGFFKFSFYLYLKHQGNGQPQFQSWKPRALETTALQSGNNKKIDNSRVLLFLTLGKRKFNGCN